MPNRREKRVRLMSLPAAALAVCAGLGLLAPAARAFHSGGVGACGVCHSTHGGRGGNAVLLREQNPTDLCLSCHATEFGNSWGRDRAVPGPQYGGGSFVFLTEDDLNDTPMGSGPRVRIPGDKAGHNVISSQRGTNADIQHSKSPGGSYSSDNLHCTSCHDPHGRGGHFRLLYGNDFPEALVNGQRFLYTMPAPAAEGIDVDGTPEGPGHHTAYRSGMSDWCANCHADLVSRHKIRSWEHETNLQLADRFLLFYDNYRGTGYLDGVGEDSYLPEVPLEFGGSTTSFRGPVRGTFARMTCVTCHRAHASSGPAAGRWDFNIQTWADEGVLSGSYRIPNPYEGTAGPAQKQLCDKCHESSSPGLVGGQWGASGGPVG